MSNIEFKKLRVLGIYFNLELRSSNVNKSYLEEIKDVVGDINHVIVFELKNLVSDYDNAEFRFYSSIFYDKVLEILKGWRTTIKKCSYNKFLLKNQKVPIKTVYKATNTSAVSTDKKCICENNMIIKTNSKNDRKFYLCLHCNKTESIQYNIGKDKNGFLLYIDPCLLCSKPIETINCIIIQNLISTYIQYGSVEYWSEILKFYPKYIFVMKPKILDSKIRKALEQAIFDLKNSDLNKESEYNNMLEQLKIEGLDD